MGVFFGQLLENNRSSQHWGATLHIPRLSLRIHYVLGLGDLFKKSSGHPACHVRMYLGGTTENLTKPIFEADFFHPPVERQTRRTNFL
jgi:hypothetical protein